MQFKTWPAWISGLVLLVPQCLYSVEHSFAPIVGYEPTYQFVAGAAYFAEHRNLAWNTIANTNGGDVYQLHTGARGDLGMAKVTFQSGIVRGFQNFYGGGKTERSQAIWGTHSNQRLEFAFPTSWPGISIGAHTTLRTLANDDAASSRFRPEESTFGVGVFQRLDMRDDTRDPRRGFLIRSDLTLVPGSFSSRLAASTFTLLEGKFTSFHALVARGRRSVVLALASSLGIAFGDPTYAFQFTLGGAARLRGYHENRFRGNSYYLEQAEIRFPLSDLFTATAFVEAGNATFAWSLPHFSFGAGVQVALPPDWIHRVRIDFAFGHDQQGVFADFGHAF